MESIQKTKKWDKVLWVTPLFMFIIFGYVLAQISGNVLFVKRIGADFLPYTYVANALVGVLAALIVAGSIGKYSIARFIQVVSALGMVVLLGLFWSIEQGAMWTYPTFLIFGQILYMVLGGIMMWDLGLKICSPLEAKRVFSFFSFGSSFGGIIAGALSSVMSEFYDTEILILAIVGSLLLVFINAAFIHWRYHKEIMPDEASQAFSQWETIKKGFNYYRKTKLARLLAFLLILFYCVRWIGDYEFQKILGDTFDEDMFSQISGYVSIVENALLIVMFLFIQRIIMNKLGVIKTLFASPTVILIPFVILFFFPVYLVAMALKVITKVVNYSSFNNSLRLMYTSIPHAIRSSVTTFIGGNSESGGMLLAGAGLIVLTEVLDNRWIIAIGIGLLVAILAIIVWLRREYVKQISHNLEGQDLVDVHTAIENLAEPAYRKIGVQELMKMVQRENLEEETMRKIVFSLGEINNVNVIPSLLDIFQKYDITVKYAVIEAIHSFKNLNERLEDLPFTRLNLIESYERIFLEEEDPDLKVFILEHLKDFDPIHVIDFLKDAAQNQKSNVQYQAIKAMKYFHDRGIIRYVKPFLKDEHPMVRASSIIALWQFTEMRPQLMKLFVELMSQEDKASILASFFIISKANIDWENRSVQDRLDHEDEEVRAMAALTLIQIDDLKGLYSAAEQLITDTPFSLIVARSIKDLSPKTKDRLLEFIRRQSESSIQTCVENLRKTYLNFDREIEYLTQERARLTTFTGRIMRH